MKEKNKEILIISSKPPFYSAGLGQSVLDSLKEIDYTVDFLTIHSYSEQPDNVISIFDQEIGNKTELFFKKLINNKKIKRFLKKLMPNGIQRLKNLNSSYVSNNGITIKYKDEANPTIPIDKLLAKINKSYDVVITLFWQDMINSSTLKAVYDKLNCLVLIYSPDMAPITGGCFYFGNCQRFSNECGKCPGLNSNLINDQSRANYLLKKHNYSNMNCVFLGNSWMNQFALKSHLFKNIELAEIIIDDKLFRPQNSEIARKELGIPPHKEFILFLRSDLHPRKGTKDLYEAIKHFIDKLDTSQKEKCLIISIGHHNFTAMATDLLCDIIDFGFIEYNKLLLCYQASDFFLNASYDDAGPSMINQSIMCGTPVICYDNGTAIDVVQDGYSGYKVNTGEIIDLAQKIYTGYRLSKDDHHNMRIHAREIALKHNSRKAFSCNLANIIKKYHSNIPG